METKVRVGDTCVMPQAPWREKGERPLLTLLVTKVGRKYFTAHVAEQPRQSYEFDLITGVERGSDSYDPRVAYTLPEWQLRQQRDALEAKLRQLRTVADQRVPKTLTAGQLTDLANKLDAVLNELTTALNPQAPFTVGAVFYECGFYDRHGIQTFGWHKCTITDVFVDKTGLHSVSLRRGELNFGEPESLRPKVFSHVVTWSIEEAKRKLSVSPAAGLKQAER